jgi:hypothetical protein
MRVIGIGRRLAGGVNVPSAKATLAEMPRPSAPGAVAAPTFPDGNGILYSSSTRPYGRGDFDLVTGKTQVVAQSDGNGHCWCRLALDHLVWVSAGCNQGAS